MYAHDPEKEIPFTQYLRPDGRRREMYAPAPPDVIEKSKKIREAGFVFEAEVLTTGQVSITIGCPVLEEDVAIQISPNGPELDDHLRKLVMDFDIDATLKRRG